LICDGDVTFSGGLAENRPREFRVRPFVRNDIFYLMFRFVEQPANAFHQNQKDTQMILPDKSRDGELSADFIDS
jgi:hypothetical protein